MKNKYLIILALMAITSLNVWARDTYDTSSSEKEEANACSQTFKTFVNYTTIFAEDLTFGLANLIPQAMEDYCPGTDDKIAATNSRVDALMERVKKVENQLTEMGYTQKQLWEQLGQNVNDMYLTPYITELRKLDQYVAKYQTVYPPYKNLLAYSMASGKSDFKNLYTKSNSNFAAMFNDTAHLIQKLQGIMPLEPNAGKMADNLYKLCWDPKSMSGDVFETRRQCNLIVRDILLNVALRVAVVKKILADKIDTVNAAIDSGNIDQAWINSPGGVGDFNYTDAAQKNVFVSWKEALPVADRITDQYADDIKNILAGKNNEKLFPLFKDFPGELREYMLDDFCYDIKKSAAGGIKYLPSVLAWYPNGQKLSSGLDPAYIVTNCMSGVNSNKRVQAKYYLAGGTKVYNYMGVLVPIPGIAKKIVTEPPIRIITTISSNTTLASFNLSSNYPLKINSKSIKSDNKNSVGSVPSFMEVDHYGSINPAYKYNGNEYSMKELIGTATASSFLEPATLSDGKSNILFVSNVYNINSATNLSPQRTADGAQLNGTVFLSFEIDKFTYVFGLDITNIGAKTERIKSPEGSYSVNVDPKETIALSCISDAQCDVSGNKVIWKDGTSVSISGGGKDISLVIDNTKDIK
ncbi:MAG: hypothetical protein K0R14_123 [Burkholderiales bacterium]|jgi:hypothetical protein|nr:hypothetical protein [Burkholderiales bacterium]